MWIQASFILALLVLYVLNISCAHWFHLYLEIELFCMCSAYAWDWAVRWIPSVSRAYRIGSICAVRFKWISRIKSWPDWVTQVESLKPGLESKQAWNQAWAAERGLNVFLWCVCSACRGVNWSQLSKGNDHLHFQIDKQIVSYVIYFKKNRFWNYWVISANETAKKIHMCTDRNNAHIKAARNESRRQA